MEQKPTNVADVALPQALVQLEHLRTRTGDSVSVMCEAIDDLTIASLTGGLSGARGPQAPVDAAGYTPEQALETMRENDKRSQALIERGTWLVGPDGEEVRPAFWFDPNLARHPLSLPGRLLRTEDRVRLLMEIMRLGHYLKDEGDANATSFPVHGAGGDAGMGTGAAG